MRTWTSSAATCRFWFCNSVSPGAISLGNFCDWASSSVSAASKTPRAWSNSRRAAWAAACLSPLACISPRPRSTRMLPNWLLADAASTWPGWFLTNASNRSGRARQQRAASGHVARLPGASQQRPPLFVPDPIARGLVERRVGRQPVEIIDRLVVEVVLPKGVEKGIDRLDPPRAAARPSIAACAAIRVNAKRMRLIRSRLRATGLPPRASNPTVERSTAAKFRRKVGYQPDRGRSGGSPNPRPAPRPSRRRVAAYIANYNLRPDRTTVCCRGVRPFGPQNLCGEPKKDGGLDRGPLDARRLNAACQPA